MGGALSRRRGLEEGEHRFRVVILMPKRMRRRSRTLLEVEPTMLNFVRKRGSRGVSSVNLRYVDMRKIDLDGTEITITPIFGDPLQVSLAGGLDEMCAFKNSLLAHTDHGRTVEIVSH